LRKAGFAIGRNRISFVVTRNALCHYDRDSGSLERVDAFFTLADAKMVFCTSEAGDYVLTTQPAEGLPQLNWAEAFGGAGNGAFSVVSGAGDGGFATAGSSSSDDGDLAGASSGTKGVIVKYGAGAEVEWVFAIEGRVTFNDVKEAGTGGFLACGRTNVPDGPFAGLNKGGYDAFMLKLSAEGRLERLKNLGSAGTDGLNCIIPESGGFAAPDEAQTVPAALRNANAGQPSMMNGMLAPSAEARKYGAEYTAFIKIGPASIYGRSVNGSGAQNIRAARRGL
jgi:hypothetical protein